MSPQNFIRTPNYSGLRYASANYGDNAGETDGDDAYQNTGNVTATSIDWHAHPTASGAHGSSQSEVSVTSDL